MPTMAYIQDMQSRLTLHTAQALGVSSLGSGETGPWGCASCGARVCWAREDGEEGAVCRVPVKAHSAGTPSLQASWR